MSNLRTFQSQEHAEHVCPVNFAFGLFSDFLFLLSAKSELLARHFFAINFTREFGDGLVQLVASFSDGSKAGFGYLLVAKMAHCRISWKFVTLIP